MAGHAGRTAFAPMADCTQSAAHGSMGCLASAAWAGAADAAESAEDAGARAEWAAAPVAGTRLALACVNTSPRSVTLWVASER